MDDKILKYKKNELSLPELFELKREVDQMSDSTIDEILSESESAMTFSQDDIDNLQTRLNTEIAREQKPKRITHLLAVCAVIMLPLLVTGTIFLIKNSRQNTEYRQIIAQEIFIGTGIGETSYTILPDGSKVNLGPQSELTYSLSSFNDTERKINYSGEGRFNIAKRPEAPFTLNVNSFEIKVLGTVFSVRSHATKTVSEIYLEEGSIQLLSSLSRKQLTMDPGETALINNETGEINIIKDHNSRVFNGKPVIFFKSATINEIASDLNLYYGIETVLTDSSLHKIKFTGSLPTNNMPQALFILENSLRVNIESDSENNTIAIRPQ